MFVIPCRKRTRQHSQSVLLQTHIYPHKQHQLFALWFRYATCCHAFCFGCVIPHGSSCVLQTHLVQSSFITLHCASYAGHAHVHYVWVICSAIYFLPFLERLRGSLADTHKLHSLRAQGSLHFIPFHSVLLHSVSLQSTRCPCCARLRCRSGCGLSCFLPCRFIFPLTGEIKRGQQKITPALVRCGRSAQFNYSNPRGLPHSSHRLPSSGSHAHTFPPARGIHFTPFRSPLGGSQSDRGHRAADAQLVLVNNISCN